MFSRSLSLGGQAARLAHSQLIPRTSQFSTSALLAKAKLPHQKLRYGPTVTELKLGTYTPQSRRSGVIARKKGMSGMWDEWGVRVPVTVLQLDKVQVVSIIKTSSPDHPRLQIGCSERKEKNTTKPMMGHFKAHGVEPKAKLFEFPITPDAAMPVGTTITAAHFVPGQLVDVTATSIGKGFQGVMKRWGFAGGRASHGNSLAHRTPGSTGNINPGRVYPGKKMPGRMGGKSATVLRLPVMKVDTVLNCIWVKGSVPGPDEQFIKVRDSIKLVKHRVFPEGAAVPFPTYIPGQSPPLPREIIAKVGGHDPLIPRVD
ncbi:hypothetical protein GGH12_003644 [Coemansia sp. RSA 1822]|nr:hypothetical protein LPJ76_003942 [Coemansia sp. RSA 638]KAJ2124447.1 hypothetical protein IW147_001813 [Coemansia sp. RSA 720]KAJ2480597.1 hypothetical protein IWW56_002358 [Coemansia sp. RSA 2131]KAJ2541751.1 hypothetical protein GGF49_003397 [Coemansia sp. RSA 1853]KAJ2561848.1 hypothetical protein GGH12_003644 [Coemansia sp. RSA 1822]KAJ2657728.1 hypothetical protein IW148_005028 [Coemansia sp. RSA 1199]